jgi:hypothetical protein
LKIFSFFYLIYPFFITSYAYRKILNIKKCRFKICLCRIIYKFHGKKERRKEKIREKSRETEQREEDTNFFLYEKTKKLADTDYQFGLFN